MVLGFNKLYQFIGNILTPKNHDYKLWEKKNKWLRKSNINIGTNVAIGENMYILKTCEKNITIDDYVSIGDFVKFWTFNQIKIGKFSMIAADVHFINGGHDSNTFEPYSDPLIIGNGCWIGNGVKIIKGVTIGNNVIIGGGEV